jgi:hypothetical protein
VSAWFSISVIAGAQALSQLICVVGAIWQERMRAASLFVRIEAAAESGIIVCEWHQDGSALLIVPGTAAGAHAVAAELIPGMFGERLAR